MITLSKEVAQALAENRPVVALESTIITHGMPWPQNLEVALQVEETVREKGAVPATIAVIDGTLYAGLERDQLEALAQAKNVAKLSRADLPVIMSRGGTGSTTVAATMIGAHLAGIKVFATGGIGGVHKGAELSFDVSADLQELAQTPVTVVCAGAKAILDLPKTLEVLETLGVPVMTLGQTTLPAFWSRDSGLPSPLSAENAAEIAAAHKMRSDLGLPGGVLVCNPIPEEAEISKETLAPIIARANADAQAHGIGGKGVTPYLLQRIYELTEGKSLEANIALVLNNARLAAEIAREMAT